GDDPQLFSHLALLRSTNSLGVGLAAHRCAVSGHDLEFSTALLAWRTFPMENTDLQGLEKDIYSNRSIGRFAYQWSCVMVQPQKRQAISTREPRSVKNKRSSLRKYWGQQPKHSTRQALTFGDR